MTKPAKRLFLHKLRPRFTLDEELLWFFNRADCELGARSNFRTGSRESSATVPSPEAAAEASHGYRRILGWLKAIPDADAGVLQAAYELRPWPVALHDEFGRLTGIVVRLACALDAWPDNRDAQQVVEMARADWLASYCGPGHSRGLLTLDQLRREAQVRFALAHHAYSVVRGKSHALFKVAT
jgi:hypothetical protein